MSAIPQKQLRRRTAVPYHQFAAKIIAILINFLHFRPIPNGLIEVPHRLKHPHRNRFAQHLHHPKKQAHSLIRNIELINLVKDK
jgi:hypothetical protein